MQAREKTTQEQYEALTFKVHKTMASRRAAEAVEGHRKAVAGNLALFRKTGGPMNPCTQPDQEWKKLSIAVDSGACENVIDAAEEVPGYPVEESRASRAGVTYATAAGEEIPNLGEVMLPMVTTEGSKGKMKMQVAEVTKPLASVKRICEAGHMVVFDEEASYMINKRTGQINYFREDGGNYMLDVWIPPNRPGDFPRQ